MGLKARTTRSSESKRAATAGRAETAQVGDVSLLDMSLVDSSGVRELKGRLAPATDDSGEQFADPSLVVRLQDKSQREELEPPARPSTSESDGQLGLFDLPTPKAPPVPADGSLFGEVKRRSRIRRPRRR